MKSLSVLFLFCSFWPWTFAMFHRKRRVEGASSRQLPFEDNVSDLFLTNQLSAARCHSLFQDARKQGTKHCRRLSGLGSDKNVHRNMLRHFLKKCGWPPLYTAPVRVFDLERQCEKTVMLPILLVHEVVAAFANKNSYEDLIDATAMCSSSQKHLNQMQNHFPGNPLVGIGFWLDGCPCNWDRTESLEVLTMNFPGLSGHNSHLRVPLACVPKRFQINHNTWDDILVVQRWSLEWLLIGQYPPCQHDGASFTTAWRSGRGGKPLEV